MPRRSCRLEDFPDILEDVGPRFERATIKGLRSAAYRLEGYTVEEIIAADAVASGELSRSVKTHMLPDGAHVTVDAPHAAAVEHGSRPHWAPIQPLIDWVITKGLAGYTSGNRDRQGRFIKKSQRTSPATQEANARKIAYAIQAKIAREGTKPRHYMRKAWARIEPEIIKHVIDAINETTP